MGRGPHAADAELFGARHHSALRTAVADLSWLLGRGYAEKSALQIVGDRYRLRERQRVAVRRSACSDAARARRLAHRVEIDELRGRELAIDGFNCLITLEAALAGGVLLLGRDGALRDLASVHGSYRRVATTARAIDIVAARLAGLAPSSVTWYLDRPVSNSGRLAEILRATAPQGVPWQVELPLDPDRVLGETRAVVATADGTILDRCAVWVDLAGDLVAREVPDAWIVPMADGAISAACAP